MSLLFSFVSVVFVCVAWFYAPEVFSTYERLLIACIITAYISGILDFYK
jgi:hypothetical protein